MPDQEHDPWALSSGLIDDVDVTITDAHFGTDAQYMDGQRLGLMLSFKTDDLDMPEADQSYWCGPGWEAKDKGARAVREDGKTKGFNKQTAIGSLIQAAMALDGVAEVLRGRGVPTDAGIWVGLQFHMERKGFEFKGVKDEKTGENATTDRLLPTAFLGVAGDTPKSQASKPAQEATGPVAEAPTGDTEPAAAQGGTSGSNGDLPPVIKAKLRKLAKEADSHDAFIEAAFDSVDGLIENEDWQAAVTDAAVIYEPARA